MTDAQMRAALLAAITIMVAMLGTYLTHAVVTDRKPRTYGPDTLLFGAQCRTCGRWKEAMSEHPSAEDKVTFWLGTHDCYPSAQPVSVLPIPGRHRS
jgi:hypothetical protein